MTTKRSGVLKRVLNNVLTLSSGGEGQINDIELDFPPIKNSRSLKRLVRLFFHGTSPTTLHVRTLSGAMIRALSKLDPLTTTSSDIITTLDEIVSFSGTILSEPSYFTPSLSIRSMFNATIVVGPDGYPTIDDIGLSPGLTRLGSSTSAVQNLRRLIRKTSTGDLYLSTMSGFISNEIDALPITATIADLLGAITDALSVETTIGDLVKDLDSIPSVNFLTLVNSIVKPTGTDDGFIIDDVGIAFSSSSKNKKIEDVLINSISQDETGAFFLNTSSGSIVKAISDFSTTSTVSEIIDIFF